MVTRQRETFFVNVRLATEREMGIMSEGFRPTQTSRMHAAPGDPTIGVHVLTEFIFCPRAGLCIYEENIDDPGEELLLEPNTDYMPRYDLHEIENALQEVKLKLWQKMLQGMAVVAITGLLSMLIHPELIWLALVGLAVVARNTIPLFVKALRLAWRQRLCLTAQPKEPDPHSTEIQRVNWWELLHAGFKSVPYKENLFDEKWKLRGKPKRVLRRESQRIPVFFKRHGKVEIRLQHKARLAAYCHLLEVCEVAESPYGVMFFGDSYEGVAIPNVPGIRKLFHDALIASRRIVLESQQPNGDPSPPNNHLLCSKCRVGEPLVHRLGETEHRSYGKTLPVVYASGGDKRSYHSHCGDRFGWLPPHNKARQKRLVLRGQWNDEEDLF